MEPTPIVWQPRVKFQDRVWLHLLLFVLTVATTTFVGAEQYASFLMDFVQPPRVVDALPMPVPALFIGLYLSHVVRVPANFVGMELGEPLLLKLASWLLWGPIPDGFSLNLHPIAFAAWFGMLATALNLFPIGQLDGGHICYSVLGPRSTYVTFVMVAVVMVLAYFSSSWIVWSGLLVVMLFLFGPSHPRVFDEHVPLDRARLLLAVFAVVMFALCFTPSPISPTELIRR